MNKYSQLLRKEALKNKKLFWDISDINHLSDEAIIERMLNYGDMKEFRIITKDKVTFSEIYKQIKKKKRSNLTPIVINYTDLYLKENA